MYLPVARPVKKIRYSLIKVRGIKSRNVRQLDIVHCSDCRYGSGFVKEKHWCSGLTDEDTGRALEILPDQLADCPYMEAPRVCFVCRQPEAGPLYIHRDPDMCSACYAAVEHVRSQILTDIQTNRDIERGPRNTKQTAVCTMKIEEAVNASS